ncbi:MAG: GlsB/YeaQ/YmgE family stress response membrane protein [Phototrophicaceae bacterium]|jgi:uncharacterized membrane protein YeaQ/YmgE (transglycosylase-associated protein family)
MTPQVSWLVWIVVGGISGWLASIVMKTNRQQGLLIDIIVGIAGAFIGGFLLSAFGAEGITGFNLWSILVSFIGALILLGLIRILMSGRRTSDS